MNERVVVSQGDESQVLVHRLQSEINDKLGKEHFSYHVVTTSSKDGKDGTNITIKVKSNDGELYELKLFKHHSESATPIIISARALYTDIDVEQYHREKIERYKDLLNQTYKTSNSGYNVISVQQQLDDESNYVYRVVGNDDGKHYKIKLQRPTVEHKGEAVVRKDKLV